MEDETKAGKEKGKKKRFRGARKGRRKKMVGEIKGNVRRRKKKGKE